MTEDLVRSVLQVALRSANAPNPPKCGEVMASASAEDWEHAMQMLAWHRLVPVAFRAVDILGVSDAIAADLLEAMKSARHLSVLQNALRFRWLEKILEALRSAAIVPVVWKGAALANLVYPDLALRQMSDLDLLIEGGERSRAEEILRALGFVMTKETPDTRNWQREAEGIEVDLHHRCRLFEQQDQSTMTIECQPRFLELESIRIYEPNAMLVHLVFHMNEHRLQQWGYFLPWLLDIGLVLSRWGSELDPERLNELLPSRKVLFWLLRTVRFLEREFAAPVPEFLMSAAADIDPYTLSEVLRSRRTREWGLPGLKGWARVVAHRLGLRRFQHPPLRPSDLLLWIPDRVREARAKTRTPSTLTR